MSTRQNPAKRSPIWPWIVLFLLAFLAGWFLLNPGPKSVQQQIVEEPTGQKNQPALEQRPSSSPAGTAPGNRAPAGK